MKQTILFVDDDKKILRGLKRMLLPMQNEWNLYFLNSGKEALELLKTTPADVVISDMRMPVMDGATLLSQIKELYPDIIRIILSGYADKEMILKSVKLAHQYLSKPCNTDDLKNIIKRAYAIREILNGEEIRQKTSQLDSLPSLPEHYQKIMAELQTKDPSIKKIGAIIAKDISMNAKIMQLVNSAFFGLPRHISDPVQAVAYLGIDTIKSLVLTIQVFSQFDLNSFKGISLEKIWQHSVKVGNYAKLISLSLKPEEAKMSDYSLIAGMLHDIGKLVLITNYGAKYQEVIDLTHLHKIDYYQAEIKILGISHSEVGAYLLGLWGLPTPIIEALAFHHRPSQCFDDQLSPLSALHIANVIDNEFSRQNNFVEFDLKYLDRVGVITKLDSFKKICREKMGKGENDE